MLIKHQSLLINFSHNRQDLSQSNLLISLDVIEEDYQLCSYYLVVDGTPSQSTSLISLDVIEGDYQFRSYYIVVDKVIIRQDSSAKRNLFAKSSRRRSNYIFSLSQGSLLAGLKLYVRPVYFSRTTLL